MCFTWPLIICMKRDINSGHSKRKWKWLKMIFGFLKKRRQRDEQKETRHEKVRQQSTRVEKRMKCFIKTQSLSTVWGGWSMAEGHNNSPGYKTLEHLVMLADKFNEARWRHSGWNKIRGRVRAEKRLTAATASVLQLELSFLSEITSHIQNANGKAETNKNRKTDSSFQQLCQQQAFISC